MSERTGALRHPDLRLDGLLRRAAAAGQRLAIRTPRGDTTFGELDASADAIAAALGRLVDGPGAAVGAASVLDPVFAAAFYGISRSRNRIIVINPLVRDATLAHVFSTAGIEVAFVPAALARRLAAQGDRFPALRLLIVIDADGDTDLPSGAVTLADVLADVPADAPAGEPAPGEPASARVRRPSAGPQSELDEVACVQFTSGTTGSPKGVLLSHRNLVANAAQIARVHGLTAASVTVNHLPLYHLMHLNSAVFAGAAQVLCTDPDPVASIALAGRERATHYYGLPARLARLAADDRLATVTAGPRLLAVMSGGSALRPAVAAVLRERLGVPVTQGYGLAELSPLSHCDPRERSKPGSVGPVVPGTECRITDPETGAELPPGRKGEVQVRGPQVMVGYLGRPHPPEIDAEGWFRTGDVGYLDEDGWLFLVDRIKDVFKVDNELVSPAELEELLCRHPDVADSVVADHPHPFSGAVVWAGVVPRDPGHPLDLDAVVRSVNDQVAEHQKIRYAEVLDEVPRSPVGKIQRRVLRERLAERTGTAPSLPLSRSADRFS